MMHGNDYVRVLRRAVAVVVLALTMGTAVAVAVDSVVVGRSAAFTTAAGDAEVWNSTIGTCATCPPRS